MGLAFTQVTLHGAQKRVESDESDTHIDGHSRQQEELSRWIIPRDVPVELVAVLVPFDRVQGLAVQVKVALEHDGRVFGHVVRDADLGQPQAEANVWGRKENGREKYEILVTKI